MNITRVMTTATAGKAGRKMPLASQNLFPVSADFELDRVQSQGERLLPADFPCFGPSDSHLPAITDPFRAMSKLTPDPKLGRL